jgi:Spy/CpxP family protein refolding chaperone
MWSEAAEAPALQEARVMRQQTSRIVPGVAALLLAAAAAQAQLEPGPGMQGPGWPGQGPQGPGFEARRERGPRGALTEMLGLSEAQQEKLRGIMDEQRPQLEALREKISANREALHQLLESGSADANAVGELVLEGRKLHEQSRAIRESEAKAIRGILTEDQQRKFDAMQQRRRERGPGRGPEGFHPQGPPPPGGAGGRGLRPPPGQSKPGQLPVQP